MGVVLKSRLLGSLLSLALIGLWSGSALAAPADPAIVEARKHFEDGTKAFNLGEFDRAVKEYKAAYNAKPDPVFLYNIAQAYRLGNDLPQALFFYRSFLRNQPNTPNRHEIESRIEQLEAQVAQKSTPAPAPTPAAPTPPETPPAPAPMPAPVPAVSPPAPSPVAAVSTTPSPPPKKPLYKKGWFWGVVVGAIVVAGGVGAGVGVALTRSGAPSSELGTQKVFLLGGAR